MAQLRFRVRTLEQILARARALMTEEAEGDEPVAATAGRRRVLPRVPVAPPSTPDKQNAVAVQCYKCGGPNHFARDCQCQQQGHVTSRRPGKLGKG